MRVPVPTNKIVLFTLAGALLTAAVAGGLAYPSALDGTLPAEVTESGLAQIGTEQDRSASATQEAATPQTPPKPNENFTPAVQTRVVSGGDTDGDSPSRSTPSPTVTGRTPTPNPNFTPSVKTRSSSGYEDEKEEYEEHEDEEEEHEDEEEEHEDEEEEHEDEEAHDDGESE
ncbi:MAG: hypothetical protein ABEK02_08155 [Haloquadratum sp.]